MSHRLPSDQAVEEVARRGGLAPADSVEAAMRRRLGTTAAHRGVALAVLGGRLERVVMVDGSAGLRLTGRRS